MLLIWLLGYIIMVGPVWCVLPEDDSSCVHKCFHQPVEACPSPKNTCRCRQLPNCQKAAVCCDLNSFQLTEGLGCANISAGGKVEALHIRNATLDVLNLTRPYWRGLTYITITDGHIGSVVGEFAKHTMVSCLNLSSNGITKFEARSLVNLNNFSFLDLSHNNLSDVPNFRKDISITLDISDNKEMLCSSLSEALNRTRTLNFYNENKTFCLSPSGTFHWFNSTEKVPLSQIVNIHKLQQNCLKRCTCDPTRLEIVPGKLPTFAVAVNCSGKKYMSLPTPLPANTISLDVSNNNITSLKELSDPSYQNLRELYADNNQISSIQPLEGTKFMNNFVTLSLRNNKIRNLETYLLSNIQFERNYNPKRVNLGSNNLHCDCNTAKDLRVWLLTKSSHIPDYEEIRCDNMDLKVIELNPSKMCQSQQDWTDYIYYIITAEVILLVGLIAKVSYDYWVFKTTGNLPWPASKMPRLPCDWLCE